MEKRIKQGMRQHYVLQEGPRVKFGTEDSRRDLTQAHICIGSLTALFVTSIECILCFLPSICLKCMIRLQRALIREMI